MAKGLILVNDLEIKETLKKKNVAKSQIRQGLIRRVAKGQIRK
jgi:hypothetical protein